MKIRKVLWLIPFVCSVAYSQNYSKRICYYVDEFTDKKEVMCERWFYMKMAGIQKTQGAFMRLEIFEGEKRENYAF